jgi:hypothetical protein
MDGLAASPCLFTRTLIDRIPLLPPNRQYSTYMIKYLRSPR